MEARQSPDAKAEWSQMAIRLRSTLGLSDDDSVLLHMGAGAVASVLEAALRNYHAYEGAYGSVTGLFTMSVFAPVGGVTREEIFGELPQRQFGEAPFGEVRKLAEVLPTTMEESPLPRRIAEVHYDIVLNGAPPVPDGVRIGDLTLPERSIFSAALEEHATRVLTLFQPRNPKYHGI